MRFRGFRFTEMCATTPLISGNDHRIPDHYLTASSNNNHDTWIDGIKSDSSAARARLYSLSNENDWNTESKVEPNNKPSFYM